MANLSAPVGFVWWRGQVLTLRVNKRSGRQVAMVPRALAALWRQDVRTGRVKA